MISNDITHTFGPWSPMRFIPVPFRTSGPLAGTRKPEEEPPAFWVTTSRMCRGGHDWRCTQIQTQTFGPLVLDGKTSEDVWTCPACHRPQPPVDTDATHEQQVCLHCSDSQTVQHAGDGRDTVTALSSLAVLHAASATLRHVASVDRAGATALLEDTHEDIRSLLEHQAAAVKQEPSRAKYTEAQLFTRIARQIGANARAYGELNIEPFPVTETEEG